MTYFRGERYGEDQGGLTAFAIFSISFRLKYSICQSTICETVCPEFCQL